MARRLIDANVLALELYNKAQNTRKRYTTPDGYLSLPWGVIADGIEQAIQSVDQAPDIDAVEVVRCRDCAYMRVPRCCPYQISGFKVDDDWYCPMGVRRKRDGE